MRSSSKNWLLILVLLLIAAAIWWLWRGRGGEQAEPARGGEDPRLLLDRVWIDSKPQRHVDYVQAMIALSDAPIGVFQKASAYHGELEIFEFKREGAGVRVHFPQTDRNRRFTYRIQRCDDLPPFDLCLTLSENPWKGAPRRYYGASDGEVETRELGDLRHRLLHRLPAH
jgi:hypothetical protein